MSNWRTDLHPELVRRIDKVIALAKAEGYDLRVVSAYRSNEEQHKLFLKRPPVTKADAGKSFHNFGLAADLAPVINGKIYWEEEDFNWSLIGKWARAANLEWGGNWKTFIDRPHVQLTAGLTTAKAMRLYKLGGNKLTKVWEYVSQNLPQDLAKIKTLHSSSTDNSDDRSSENFENTDSFPAKKPVERPEVEVDYSPLENFEENQPQNDSLPDSNPDKTDPNIAREVSTSETKETETGTKSVEVTEKTALGDAPDAEPRKWLNVEDWKPFVLRMLWKVWAAFLGLLMTAYTAIFGATEAIHFDDWRVWIVIAIFVTVFLFIIALIITAVFLLIWHFNRKEIVHYKTEAIRAALDPESFNLGLNFEKK